MFSAAISDVITSLIATAMQAGINVFDYFNAIQRHSQAVKEQPEKWLPWNYDQ
jgi:transposase